MKQRSAAGFTLVEILVVISIISMLASVVLASVNTVQAAGRDGKRNEDLVQFRNALELYAANNGGKYPSVVNGEVSYTSTGVSTAFDQNGNPECGTGTGWTNPDDANGDAAAFVSSMQPYLSTLPTDPINNSSHCYIYRSSQPGGTGANTAVLYDPEFETGANTDQPVGVVTGYDPTYGSDVGLPDLVLNQIIGVNQPTAQIQPGQSCTGTPNCSQFTAALQAGNITACTRAFSSNNACQVQDEGEFYPPLCVPVPGFCSSQNAAQCSRLASAGCSLTQ